MNRIVSDVPAGILIMMEIQIFMLLIMGKISFI